MARTEVTFVAWEPLVAHVVSAKFWWVYTESGTDANLRLQRGIGYDDLMQEGRIGLLQAIDRFVEGHGSGASFKTYAYQSIYRQIRNYIRDNISPLKVGRWEDVEASGDERVISQFKEATNYLEFSAMRPNRRDVDSIAFAPTPPRNMMWHDEPCVDVDKNEYTENCMRLLRGALLPHQISILLDRYNGDSWRVIGDRYGKTKEWARLVGGKAMGIARRVLRSQAAETSIRRWRKEDEGGQDDGRGLGEADGSSKNRARPKKRADRSGG